MKQAVLPCCMAIEILWIRKKVDPTQVQQQQCEIFMHGLFPAKNDLQFAGMKTKREVFKTTT